MRKTSKLSVILFGACAVLWTLRAVMEVIYRTYHDSVFWFVMNILCALLWTAAFVMNLIRYRRQG